MSKYVTAPPIPEVVGEITEHIKQEIERRSFLVTNELRNSAMLVLRGQRSGRRYKVPGTYQEKREVVGTYTTKDGKVRKKTRGTGEYEYRKYKRGRYYTASAPGEPPAVRTGAFRMGWQPTTRVVYGTYVSRIENDIKTENGQYTLGEILEDGTGRMAPRPYQEQILEKAKPKVLRIYNEPYF